MNMNEHLNCLMAEIGPLVDAESVVAYEGHQWDIFFTNGSVELRHIASHNKFLLEASLGRPFLENISFLSDMVLTYNYLHEEHGGARIAKISSGRGWVLLFDVFDQGITASELSQIILNFYLVSLQWSAIIQTESSDSDDYSEVNEKFNVDMLAIRP